MIIEGVETSATAFVGYTSRGPVNQAREILSFADFERAFGPLDAAAPLTYAVDLFFANGGRKAHVVRASSAAAVQGDPQARTGLYALDAVDPFNLLVLPDPGAGIAISAALDYCKQRRAFMLLDPPLPNATPAAVQAWIEAPSTPKSPNGAAYFPRLRVADPHRRAQPETIPSAGAIAGVYARTDALHGVWRAPAGPDASISGVDGLEVSLTDPESATLVSLGLNPMRVFPGHGPLVWGARTLAGSDQTPSEWKYVPVRRTALYLEQSVDRGTQWAEFEPNAEPLWAQIRLTVDAFMRTLFEQGAFQGTSPPQAYLVRCGSDTTTQADIDRGVVNIVVGFAPLKPAEFVFVRIAQRAG